jgi:hypothetical protein
MPGLKASILLVLPWLATCAGCGNGSGLVPVEGTITLDGQPMAGVHVLFDQPELPPNENKGYMGKTDEQGHYALRSIDGTEGVPPGSFRVSLTTAVTDPSAPAPAPPPGRSTTPFYPESPPPPPERVPPAYRGGKLSFTVTEDGTDAANFDLKSR